MTLFLRQSTTTDIRMGPFVDVTDGVTAETGVTLANAEQAEVLKANGAATVAMGGTFAAVTNADGWYDYTVAAGDVDTIGETVFVVQSAGTALPVFVRTYVVEEAVYDDLFAAAADPFTVMQSDAAAVESELIVVHSETTAIQVDTGNIYSDTTHIHSDSIIVESSVQAVEADTSTDGVALTAAAVDAIWDEVLTGATHNVADSAGRRVRDLQEFGVYEDGAIWIDTVNGSPGTTNYESGTVYNPVNTIADANTLATALGISRFRIAPGSSITFAAAQTNQEFLGHGWTLALGGQNIAGSYFEGATVSGTGTGAAPVFVQCVIGATTLAGSTLRRCRLTGTLTASAASDYYLDTCFSGVAGAGTPVFDFGAAVANTNLSMRHYSGGIQIDNKNGTGTDQMSLEGNGQLIVAASSGGAISVRGNFTVTNTGGATITYDGNSSSLVVIESDTTAIETATSSTASDLAAIESELILTHSETTQLQSDTAAIESELILTHSETTVIQSQTTVIESDSIKVESNTEAIHSQTTVIESDSIFVESSIVIVESDTTALEAALTGAHAEPAGVPAANETLADKIGYLFMALRNQVTVTATKKQFFDDGGTAEWEKDLSDDGTTYTETEGNAI